MYSQLTRKKPIRKHISILTGAVWMDELIHNPNGASFYENMGMKVPCFMILKNLLEDHGALYDSKHVTATEKLGILLYMLITGLSNRKLQQRFQRSASTISITINQLVKDITGNRVLIRKFIALPAHNAGTPDEIKSNPKFSPYFNDCVGAVDGSHIPVHVNDQTAFVNRKGYPSQNVLAICNFNMEFTYVMPGWEGSAHDGRLWDEARISSLKIPPGKWLLGDAGFPLSESCLVPYRSTKYHLKDWDVPGGKKPQTYKELFNLRHASARNVKVIIVMAFIHNFLRVTDPSDIILSDEESTVLDPRQPDTVEYGELHHRGFDRRESTRATKLRDEIAKKMWSDYQHLLRYCQRHSRPLPNP
ncbi:hypothetical protein PSHT_08211 [Puccinia striiformis]|uniref:Uncharacterized protein n=1 Tax=Puccinia striiformis TaxID=27350 RepID=A0A2S4VRB2_9BASI|nr:hypothetical protein PSHT_08211 [Puccinia striiformis]